MTDITMDIPKIDDAIATVRASFERYGAFTLAMSEKMAPSPGAQVRRGQYVAETARTLRQETAVRAKASKQMESAIQNLMLRTEFDDPDKLTAEERNNLRAVFAAVVALYQNAQILRAQLESKYKSYGDAAHVSLGTLGSSQNYKGAYKEAASNIKALLDNVDRLERLIQYSLTVIRGLDQPQD